MEVLQLERALYAIRTEIYKYRQQNNGNNPDYICLSESLFDALCDITVNVVQVAEICIDGIPYIGSTIYGIQLRTDPTLTGFKFIIGKEIDCGNYFFGGVRGGQI